MGSHGSAASQTSYQVKEAGSLVRSRLAGVGTQRTWPRRRVAHHLAATFHVKQQPSGPPAAWALNTERPSPVHLRGHELPVPAVPTCHRRRQPAQARRSDGRVRADPPAAALPPPRAPRCTPNGSLVGSPRPGSRGGLRQRGTRQRTTNLTSSTRALCRGSWRPSVYSPCSNDAAVRADAVLAGLPVH